jgi:hypothetical protein
VGRRRLEIISNIVVILGVLLFGTLMIRDRLPERSSPGIRPGDQLGRLPGYSWNSYPRTLLMAMRMDCQYCERSIPFYQKLAWLERDKRLSAHLLAVFPSQMASARAYAQVHQLVFQIVGEVDLSMLRITGTPTLVLVDPGGRALKVWVGQMTAAQEAEVIWEISGRSGQG